MKSFEITYVLMGIFVMLFFLVVAILAYPGPKKSSRRSGKVSA